MWDIMPYGWNRRGDFFPAEVERMLDDFSRGISSFFRPLVQMQSARGIEMYEENGNLFVQLELPGIDPKDVEVRLLKDRLIVRSSKKEEEEKKEENRTYYVRKYSSKLDYEIALPFEVDPDKAKAEFVNGVLTVSAPQMAVEEGGKVLSLSSGQK